jgi:hypothetical protein
MKAVLQIMTRKNYPISDGGQKCIAMHSQILKFLGAELHGVMGNVEDACADWREHMPEFSELLVFPRCHASVRKQPFRAIADYVFSEKPRGAQVLTSAENKRRVMDYIAQNEIGTVLLESPYAGEYIDYDQLKVQNVRVITFAHNVEYEFQRDVLSKFGFLSRMEIKRTYRYERANLRKADRVISISPADYRLLRKEFQIENLVYMPTPYLRSEHRWHDTESRYIVFNGSLDFYVNYYSMKKFISEVFYPLIECHPDIKLVITGRNQESIQKEFSHKNIEFTGFLTEEALYRLMEECLFLVSPVIKGSGTKMKLVQGLSMGIPIVASRHCFDGVPFDEAQPEPYLVADMKEDYIRCMERLALQREERERLSANADTFFKEQYDYRYNKEKWQELLF